MKIKKTVDLYSMENSDRFCFPQAASKYPSQFRQKHFRDWLEKKALIRTFNFIPKGARVLDFPCGTGRLTNILLEEGFSLTSADRSKEMLKRAEANYQFYKPSLDMEWPKVEFRHEDLFLGTKFNDNHFDVVVCHRLFHHLVETKTRIMAIRELKRISKQFIIFSFFNSNSIGACIKSMGNTIKGNKPTDRIPISKKTITRELADQDLKVKKIVSRLWGLSPLCIIVAQVEDV